MRQLNKLQSALFIVGGILMVAGVGLFVFGVARQGLQQWASLAFLLGAVLFAAMQTRQSYDGRSITIRRLRRIMLAADACFVLAGLLMAEQAWRVLYAQIATTVGGYTGYMQLVWNNWVVVLLIGAILEMYTMHRISSELAKETPSADASKKNA